MSSNGSLIANLILSIGTAVLIFATQPLYETSLFNWSLTAIPNAQAGMSSFSAHAWELWSNAGVGLAVAAPIAVPIIQKIRWRAVYYLLFLSAVLFLSGTTKTTYQQARPFWQSSTV